MHDLSNTSNFSKQSTSSIASIKPSSKPNLLKQVFNTFENELLNITTPLPTLKVKEPTTCRKFENERKKRNALAEAMQSQSYVAKVKKMYPNVSDTSFHRKNDRGWKPMMNAHFVSPTPPIPTTYESKLHELDALIPQLKYEHRLKEKEAQKLGTKELKLQLDQTVPSQLLSPSFTLPPPTELPIAIKSNSNIKKLDPKETNEKLGLPSHKTRSKLKKNLNPIFLFPSNPSPISSIQEGSNGPSSLKSTTPSNALIDPFEWLASHHPVLKDLPPSTTNPNIEHLLSSFTQSVLKKCYLHEIHSTLPPHRIADASSKTSMERVIHHVLSGTQKDDVENLGTLLPINWDAKKLVMNSKADITHQWEATHELIQTLNAAEAQMIPNVIHGSRLKVPTSQQTKSLGNYSPGTAYILERETKFDFDSNTFHSSMRNLVTESEHARDLANLTYKAHLDKNDSSSSSSLIIGLHDEITDLEDFNWEIELNYTDEVQTFKSQVIRFLRELNEGKIDVKHLSNSHLNLPQTRMHNEEEVEPLTVKGKIMVLERLCFPTELPLPTHPDYQSILFTLILAMELRFACLSESAARLLCLITNCKIPSTTFHSCSFHLESSLSSGSLLQQWASAFFLVKLKVLDPVLEYMKKKLGNQPTTSELYSPTLFLLQLSPHHFLRLADCLSPLLDHCSYHSRQAVVLILKQSAMVWREVMVHRDWLQVIGSHRVVISDEGEGLESFPKRILKEEFNKEYPEIVLKYQPIHSVFRKIVQMMFEDWCVPLRDQCAEMVVDLDLLPLVMLQLNEMLLSNESLTQKKALRALASMKWISSVAWNAFLACFSSDYLTIRVEACKTARSLGLCHSLIVNELLKRCLDIEPRVRAQAIRVLPYVATSSVASHLVLREFLSLLSNELSILVKLQGAKALLQLVQRMQDKSTLNPEPLSETQFDQVKTLLTEWSTSEVPEEKLLQKEALHCLTHLIGGNTLLLRTTNEFKEQERMNEDKTKIIEKVRELSQRTQVLETLKRLTSQNQLSSPNSSSSSFSSPLITVSSPFSISIPMANESQKH